MGKRAAFFVFFFAFALASALGQDEQPKFPKYNFNVGGGLGIGRGAVASYVGNSFQGTAGAGLNFSRIFGASAEYMYYDLTMRPYVQRSQSLPNEKGSLSSISLNGLVRSPYHLGRFGEYGIFGVGFFRRTESTNEAVHVGSICQPSWMDWWDLYCTGSPPTLQGQNYPNGATLGSFSKIAGGYNFGGGITYNWNHFHRSKIYFEWRHQKAYTSDKETVAWPITVGLRW